MFRSILALAILLVPFGGQGAADAKTPQAVIDGDASAVVPADGVTLSTILAKHNDVRLLTSGVSVMRAPSRHLLVARVNSDGSSETACVVNVEAARNFMAPARAIESSVNEQEK